MFVFWLGGDFYVFFFNKFSCLFFLNISTHQPSGDPKKGATLHVPSLRSLVFLFFL